jgi:3-phosphoshikimate 1-carboxyvinyltransferase
LWGAVFITLNEVVKSGIIRFMDITITKSTVSGSLSIPASKSQTIRALLVASFGKEVSTIHNALDSDDTASCIRVCEAFGAIISEVRGDTLIVTPAREFPPHISVDCGNSGTTLYLALTLAATTSSVVTFDGDNQLRNRPVGELINSLRNLGATCHYLNKEGFAPFTIQGPIRGGKTSIASPTSQYLSSLLLGTPLATGDSEINVTLLHEKPYVGLTLGWLDQQEIAYTSQSDLSHFSIKGNQKYTSFETTISGDYSSASFFFCAAAITGSSLTVEDVDKDDPQGDKAVLDVLQKMGCSVKWNSNKSVTIQGPSASLVGGTFDLNDIPDALPVLAVTACFAEGTSILENIEHTRIKETDRITVMRENLERLGAHIEEQEDALIIHSHNTLRGGTVLGYGDHRIIMAMAVAGLQTDSDLTIEGVDAVDVTFPTFFSLLHSICDTPQKELT